MQRRKWSVWEGCTGTMIKTWTSRKVWAIPTLRKVFPSRGNNRSVEAQMCQDQQICSAWETTSAVSREQILWGLTSFCKNFFLCWESEKGRHWKFSMAKTWLAFAFSVGSLWVQRLSLSTHQRRRGLRKEVSEDTAEITWAPVEWARPRQVERAVRCWAYVE